MCCCKRFCLHSSPQCGHFTMRLPRIFWSFFSLSRVISGAIVTLPQESFLFCRPMQTLHRSSHAEQVIGCCTRCCEGSFYGKLPPGSLCGGFWSFLSVFTSYLLPLLKRFVRWQAIARTDCIRWRNSTLGFLSVNDILLARISAIYVYVHGLLLSARVRFVRDSYAISCRTPGPRSRVPGAFLWKLCGDFCVTPSPRGRRLG